MGNYSQNLWKTREKSCQRLAPLRPVRPSGMQTTQMTGGGARSRALRARGHDPFGYAQDKKRRGPKGPPLQGLFTESCAGERLPEEGEEAGAGAEAVVSKGPFRAPRGMQISCKGWQQEAAG